MEIAPRHLHAEAESDAWDAAQALSDKAAACVHDGVHAGPFPGMSDAFDAHMGAACWTDPAYAPDASMWAAAWKAATAAERERCMGALDSHGRYWVENRSRIIDAVAAVVELTEPTP